MSIKRTFGWVQNPGDLKKLKKVVSIFLYNSVENQWLRKKRLPFLMQYGLISKADYSLFLQKTGNSEMEIEYSTLKGKGAQGGSRASAICSGIIQAVIDGQQNKLYTDASGNSISIKKPYTDDWSAEGYLRWAISCGLLEYNKSNDSCKLSPLGLELAKSDDDSPEEKEALSKALLSYPPVLRILNLLKEKDNQTKFDLGNKLGFKGEMGFTSIPQAIYLCDYCEAEGKDRAQVRSNDEGDSDKYARGIVSWCSQMGWVDSSSEDKTDVYRGKSYTARLQTYSLTRAGEKAIIKANGNSSNPRLPRVLMFEMLASNKAHGSDYLRYQRAAILKAFSRTEKTLEQLKEALKGYDLELDSSAIEDHIQGLLSIGLDIQRKKDKYILKDDIIGLELPPRVSCIKDDVNDIVDRVRAKLVHLDHKYLLLIDLAYSDAASRVRKNADAREFEIQTADLFTKELGFNGMRLGDSKRPDIIISYKDKGTIIDNKSYKDGFNINKTCADEMSRYINENIKRLDTLNPNKWWGNFDEGVSCHTFLFITSYLKGEFEKQLEYISKANEDIKGAAIGVENLLYFSEGIKSGVFTPDDFYHSFHNQEMIFTL